MCNSLQDYKRQEATGWGNRHQMGGRKNKVIGRHGYVGLLLLCKLHMQLTSLKAFEGLILKFDLVLNKCDAFHVTAVPEAPAAPVLMINDSHYL